MDILREDCENATSPRSVVSEEQPFTMENLTSLLNMLNEEQPSASSASEKPDLNPIEDFLYCLNRLVALEKWEERKKNYLTALISMAQDLHKDVTEIKQLEKFLVESGVKLDEEDFQMFCNQHISTDDLTKLADFRNDSKCQLSTLEEQAKNIASKTAVLNSKIKNSKTNQLKSPKNFIANEDGMVVIGPNGTTIAKTALDAINWSLPGGAITRKILVEVFGREVLISHSLTGRPSPAFVDCNKPAKDQLDPLKVADIIHWMTKHTKLTAKQVRSAITIKCADENKLLRLRQKKTLQKCNQQ